jgi:hypothetical protein
MTSRPLAQIEWQLIMRMCDLPSLLVLARCSRSTLRAASSDFAWGALSLVMLRSTQLPPPGCIRASSLLCRFARLGVRWVHPVAKLREQPLPLPAEIAAVLSVPGLVALDLLGRRLEGPELEINMAGDLWFAARTNPGGPLHNLTSLSLNDTALSMQTMYLLAQACPNLKRLHVQLLPHPHPGCPEARNFFSRCIVYARVLAELQSRSYPRGQLVEIAFSSPLDFLPMELAVAEPLGSMLGLASLEIDNIHESAWLPVLTAPNMATLRQLTLERVTAAHGSATSCRKQTPIDFAAIFANLPLLHSLTLRNCASIDLILAALTAHLSAASASLALFRSLCVVVCDGGMRDPARVAKSSRAGFFGPTAPSIVALRALLDLAPSAARPLLGSSEAPEPGAAVQLTLLVESLQQCVAVRLAEYDGSTTLERAAKEWQRVYEGYASLQSCYPNRVRLSTIASPLVEADGATVEKEWAAASWLRAKLKDREEETEEEEPKEANKRDEEESKRLREERKKRRQDKRKKNKN